MLALTLYSDQTHYDAVKLIICCSEGTPYQDFIHQMVEVEVDATFQFLKTLHRLGKAVPRLTGSFAILSAAECLVAYLKLSCMI